MIIQMKLVILLLCMVQYVSGVCMIQGTPSNNWHITAAQVEAHLNSIGKTTIGGSLTSGYAPFYECGSIKSIEIPAMVTSIGYAAFEKAPYLWRVDFSQATGLKHIGDSAFEEVDLHTLDLTGATALETIGREAFRSTPSIHGQLSSVKFGAALKTIGKWAFEYKKRLTSVDFSQATALTTIGQRAFHHSKVSSVDFSGATSLTSIGNEAFYKVDSYPNTPASVIFSKKPTIGDKAFHRDYYGTEYGPNAYTYCLRTPDSSGHVSAAALDGVTEIGSSGDYTGFYGCSALTSIEIPATVNTIHDRAFYNSGLTSITILGDNINYGAQVFASSAKTLSQICGYPPGTSLAISSQSGQCTNGWCASGSGWNTGDGSALNDIECTNAFSTCSTGEYYTAGSAVADAICSPCPAGQFQDNDYSVATSCTSWTSCSALEYLVTAGSATADAVCESWNGKRRLASGNGIGSFTDAPVASPSELNAVWSGIGCETRYDTVEVTSGVPDLSMNVTECKEYASTTNKGWWSEYIGTTGGVPDLSMNETMCEEYALSRQTNGMNWQGPSPLGSNFPHGCIVVNYEHVHYNSNGTNDCSVHSTSKCIKYDPYNNANRPKGCIVRYGANVCYNHGGANDCSVHSNSECLEKVVHPPRPSNYMVAKTYQAETGLSCDVGKICFTGGDVLECPSGAVRLNETHCSSEKEVVHDALQSNCPL